MARLYFFPEDWAVIIALADFYGMFFMQSLLSSQRFSITRTCFYIQNTGGQSECHQYLGFHRKYGLSDWRIRTGSSVQETARVCNGTTVETGNGLNNFHCGNILTLNRWALAGRRRAFTEAADTDVLHKCKSLHLRLPPVTMVSSHKGVMSGSEKGYHIICWR